MSFKCLKILLIISILLVGINMVWASDNATDSLAFDVNDSIETVSLDEDATEIFENISQKTDTQIQLSDINSYYKEKNKLVGYLKDADGTPVKNKTLSIFLNGKTYNKTTDSKGKVSLDINLKPNTYMAAVKFSGDNDFNSSEANALIKIKKTPLSIKTSNFNTYVHSDIFFKAKVFNKITGNPVSGIRVAFKVYSSKTKKYTYYYATTNEKGIAVLNKDLKVGSYKISAQIMDSKNNEFISFKDSARKVTMKVNPTKEKGCCSFYIQVSGSEAVTGFRRDGTEAVNIFIKNVKWYGKAAVKQYKNTYGYFFHSIVTADGWMVGNGGIEDGSLCKSIEKLAGEMVKSNKITTSVLKKIQKIKRNLGFGHFSIKAPNGKFAVVYQNKLITGKLKPGEYLCSPNGQGCYRYGTYAKFSTDPAKAGVKVLATDKYGVNRRDITVFHWKATTSKAYKTTSQVKVYALNDNGKLVGKSTAYLKDNIKFKNKFFSRDKLPKTPNALLLGTHNFGNIDKLIKTPTAISAPSVTNQFNTTKYFKITVKNQKTKKVISGVKIKVKVSSANMTKTFSVKTDSKGIAKINTESLLVGNYEVSIQPDNNKYLISAKSKITIKE